jgi:hypothetical protein
VGRQAKAIAAVVAVAVIAAGVFLMVDAVAGLGVLVVGVLGVVVVLRRSAGGSPAHSSGGRLKGRRARGDTPLDLLPDTTVPITSSPAAPLPTWTPPAELIGDRASGEDSGQSWDSSESWDAGQSWDSSESWEGDGTWSDRGVALDTNPLDALDGLEEVDVVAEVERIDARGTAPGQPADDLRPVGVEDRVGSNKRVVSPINENVASADDIMAASQATELTVVAPAAADNSELAKLLAKVQARLAAYE